MADGLWHQIVPLVVKTAMTMLESLVIAKPNLACYSLGSLWVTETASECWRRSTPQGTP